MFKNVREQDVFTRAHRVNVLHTNQPQQGSDCTRDFLTQQLPVFLPGNAGRLQRRKYADRDTGIRTRSVDGKLYRVTQRAQALCLNAPLRQTFLPGAGSLAGGLLEGFPLPARLVWVHPGFKILRGEVREV
jgi:hypothetical protein